MKVIPRTDRVVIRRDKQETETAGGIALLTSDEKPYFGEVVEVGPGKEINGKIRPLEVRRGDRVLFGKFSGVPVDVNGEEVLVMREDDVMVVLA